MISLGWNPVCQSQVYRWIGKKMLYEVPPESGGFFCC